MQLLLITDPDRRSTAALSSRRSRRLARPQRAASPYVEVVSAAKPAAAAAAADKSIDVLAGAAARAASQSTIHPLDTLKVRMQAPLRGNASPACASAASKYGLGAGGRVASLYKGVGGAASGAGIAIGTYFAFYGVASRALERHTDLPASARAFLAGAAGAIGSSFVKVPAAVCIRSVQANLYPSVLSAAACITRAAGVRGLYTGYLPTVLEDVPDMAFKFAAYESMRAAHARLTGRTRDEASRLEDLCMGGAAGALAAAATTPLDVLKTRMMCSASSRPTFRGALGAVLAEKRGIAPFFAGVGPRALSNGLNSAVFFMFFEAIRSRLLAREAEGRRKAAAAARTAAPTLTHACAAAPMLTHA
jgi:solute carrier family 25 S-adenosylmethionine transporter 26